MTLMGLSVGNFSFFSLSTLNWQIVSKITRKGEADCWTEIYTERQQGMICTLNQFLDDTELKY